MALYLFSPFLSPKQWLIQEKLQNLSLTHAYPFALFALCLFHKITLPKLGSSNLSVLTEAGATQAVRCRKALAEMNFDHCFSSPISRAKCLEAVDAKNKYPKEFTAWREDPLNFSVNGVYPILQLWETTREAWLEILSTPGEEFLVVTHKSILRALICTALGLGPESDKQEFGNPSKQIYQI